MKLEEKFLQGAKDLISAAGGFTGTMTWVLPAVVFFVSFLISLLFGLPLWLVLFSSSLPGVVLLSGAPLGAEFNEQHALLVFERSWWYLLLALLGLALGRFLVSNPKRLTRGARWFSFLSLLSAGIVFLRPTWFQELSSQIQWSIILFSLAAVSIGLALASMRFLRSGLIFLFWGGLACLLGFEVWSHASPKEFLPSWVRDVRQIMDESRAQLAIFPERTPDVVLHLLGGSQIDGYPLRAQNALPSQLQVKLNERGLLGEIRKDFRVKRHSGIGWGVSEFEDIASTLERSKDYKREIVVLSGWYQDLMGETKQHASINKLRSDFVPTGIMPSILNSLNGFKTVQESVVLQGILNLLKVHSSLEDESDIRLSMNHYQDRMEQVLKLLQEKGFEIVFYTEPVLPYSSDVQKKFSQLSQMAGEWRSEDLIDVLIQPDTLLSGKFYLKENLLNEKGVDILSGTIVGSICS